MFVAYVSRAVAPSSVVVDEEKKVNLLLFLLLVFKCRAGQVDCFCCHAPTAVDCYIAFAVARQRHVCRLHQPVGGIILSRSGQG